MRVLELIYGFQVEGRGGGVGRFGLELSRVLKADRVEVHLCGLFDEDTPLEVEWLRRLNAEGIPTFCASQAQPGHPYRSFWGSLRALWAWQTQNRAEVLHSHSEFGDPALLVLKFHPSRPKIIRTVHYGYKKEWRKRPARRLFLTGLLYPWLFDLEVGVSQSIREALDHRPAARLLKKHARCIHNAIDLRRFQQAAPDREAKRRSLGVPEGAVLIGSLGRLTEQKGYTHLIEAAAILVREQPGLYFLIAGEGELRESLQAQVQACGLGGRVVFGGARRDIEQILPCLDLFVSSSLWEGFPTVIMESMAAGIPIVATDIPGSRDLVRDRQNGWTAPPADAQALARAIRAALEDEPSRREFSERNRQQAGQFAIEAVAAEYEQVYATLSD